MRIAVTGASGFVGRHVIQELINQSIDTVAVTRDPSSLSYLDDKVSIVKFDISCPCENSLDHLGRPDALIHLAWGGLPNYWSRNHFESELPKQYNFLKSIVMAGLPSLLVTGTCFEYGMQSGSLSENLPTRPGNPYGYAKDALRRQLEFLNRNHPFNFTWARLFYSYGEWQSENSLYGQFRNAVMLGQRYFDMSGGEQLRDYLPVSEVARIIVRLALRRCGAGVVNVCSGKPVSVRKLVENWLEESGWKMSLNLGRHPYPDYEPMAFWGDREYLDVILGGT